MALRYYTPSRQQYVSTFVPMPLDFLAQQLEGRQRQYDISEQTIAEAEDIYGGMETSVADVGLKNQLIDKTFTNIHDLVQKKYSSDYGQAYNEIKGEVAKFKRHSFWTASKDRLAQEEAYKRRRINLADAGKLVEAYDPTKMAMTYNKETDSYDIPDFQNALFARPDYSQVVEERLSRATNNMVSEMAPRLSSDPRFYEAITTRGLRTEDLDKYIQKDPDAFNQVVNEFYANPAFRAEYGDDRSKAEVLVKDIMKGQVASQINKQFMSNPDWGRKDDEPESRGIAAVSISSEPLKIKPPSVASLGMAPGATKYAGKGMDDPFPLSERALKQSGQISENIEESYSKEKADFTSRMSRWGPELLPESQGKGFTYESALKTAKNFNAMMDDFANNFVEIQPVESKEILSKEKVEGTMFGRTFSVIDTQTGEILPNTNWNQVKKDIIGKDVKSSDWNTKYIGYDRNNFISDNGDVFWLESKGKEYLLVESPGVNKSSMIYQIKNGFTNPNNILNKYGEWKNTGEYSIRGVAGLTEEGTVGIKYEVKDNKTGEKASYNEQQLMMYHPEFWKK